MRNKSSNIVTVICIILIYSYIYMYKFITTNLYKLFYIKYPYLIQIMLMMMMTIILNDKAFVNDYADDVVDVNNDNGDDDGDVVDSVCLGFHHKPTIKFTEQTEIYAFHNFSLMHLAACS